MLTVSEWADRYRRLSSESSAEPGVWRTDRAPYQRGMMDAFNEPGVHTIIIMSSSQIGKTEFLLNAIGYHIDVDPAPILLLQPTLEMAEAFSKDRLAPMLRDTPILKDKVKDARARDSNNTLLHKAYPAGHITMAGANSPASLASRPIRIVLADEVDRYGASAGTEGDPVNLAVKRTTTFWNRKVLLVSTPGVKGLSRIEAGFEESDKRRYHVPCPLCGAYQVLVWSQVKWDKDELGEYLPETARYVCIECEGAIVNKQKLGMLRRGRWIATGENPRPGVAGFHLSEMYSPWVTWPEMVGNFLAARKRPETLKTWINTSLGESWEEEGEKVDPDSLYARREHYNAEVPLGVAALFAGIDVQDDRLEATVWGFGAEGEMWAIEHSVWHGDTASALIYEKLDAWLSKQYLHESGEFMPITASGIDTAGHRTQTVYKFCGDRWGRRVYALKGAAGQGKPIASRPSRSNAGKVRLFTVGVDTAKELLNGRLQIQKAGPGYIHFPRSEDVGIDEEYFEQLTAERAVRTYRKGHPVRVWEKVRARNEALDTAVYALAAYEISRPNIAQLLVHYRATWDEPVDAGTVDKVKVEVPDTAVPPPHVPRPTPPPRAPITQPPLRRGGRGGFSTSW